MKNIFVLIFLLFAAFVFAQSPGTPDIQFQASFRITNAVNGALDTVIISGYVDECAGRFTNSDIAIGDSIYVLEGSDLLVFGAVTTRTISLGIATFKAIDFGGAGILPSNGQAAIFRPTTNYQFPGDICGLNPNLQQYITARFMMRLDETLANLVANPDSVYNELDTVRLRDGEGFVDLSEYRDTSNVLDSLAAIPAAETIESADKLVGTDSTITFQKLIDQTRDSLQVDTLIASNTALSQSTVLGAVKGRKHVGFNLKLTSAESQDEAINLPSVADVDIGTRFTFSVRDSSLSYDYYLLPESFNQLKVNDRYASKYYFDANEIAVFTLVQSGSEKYWRLESTTSNILTRTTLATDFKTNRFLRGSTVKTELGANYFIQSVAPIDYNSGNPDSLFVYETKDKIPLGKNWFRASEELDDQTYWPRLGTDIQVDANVEPSPYGRNTADRLVYVGTTLRGSSTYSITSGQSYTFSCWLKQAPAASNDDANFFVELNDNSGGLVEITSASITTEWQFFEVTLTASTTAAAFVDFGFYNTADASDTLYISGVQFNEGDFAFDYRRTFTAYDVEGTLYSVYQPEGGLIEIDKLHNDLLQDHELIIEAAGFASATKTQTVYWETTRTFRDTILLPQHVGLKGSWNGGATSSSYATDGTVVYLDLNDDTKNAIEFTGGGVGYNQGNVVEGILFVPISDVGSVIYTEQSNNAAIINVTIDNTINSTKYVTNGIHIGSGSLGTIIDHVTILDCEVGFLNNGSVLTEAEHVSRVLDCGIGIKSNGPFYAENLWLEALDSCGIIHTADNLTIKRIYTETVPKTASSLAPTIHLIGGNIVDISNGTIGGDIDLGVGHTLVKIENVKNTTLSNLRFVNTDSCFTTRSTTGLVTVRNCHTDEYLPYEPASTNFVGIYDSTKVIALNNSYYSLSLVRKNWIPRTRLYDADLYAGKSDTISINDPTVSGDLKLNGPTVKNLNENIVIHSERVESGVGGWSNLGSVTFTQNDTIAPDGATTAERVTFSSGIGEWRFIPSVTLETGQWYTISFYVANSSFDEISVELGDISANAKAATLTNSDTWIRYNVTIQHTNSTNTVDFVTNGSAGQYCHFWGVQVERNQFVGEYVQTTGTAIEAGDVNPSLTIPEGDVLEFDGDVALQSAIIDSTGSVGSDGSIPVSTGDGWIWKSATAVADDLADVSLASDDATESTYTMKSTIPVNFKSSDANTILYLDETNEKIGVKTTSVTGGLTVGGSAGTIHIANAATTANTYTGVGFNPNINSSTYASIAPYITGGLVFNGFGVGITEPGITFSGHSFASAVAPSLLFVGWKPNGTGRQAKTGTEKVFMFQSGVDATWNTGIMTGLGNGNVGINTTSPQSLLDVQGAVGAAGVLTLSTKELTVVDGDKLGQINFNAPLESDGSDAILNGASIWAEADATFSATVNTTDLVFATGNSEAATEKVRVTATGTVKFQEYDADKTAAALSKTDFAALRVATDGTVIVDTMTHIGQMNFTDSSYTITITGVEPITNAGNNLFSSINDMGNVTIAGDSITIPGGNWVTLAGFVSLSGTGVYKLGLTVNGTEVSNYGAHHAITGDTRTFPIHYSYYNVSGTDIIKPTIELISGVDDTPEIVGGSITVELK